MSVHLDLSHQLAISHVGIAQASNDANRPRQHPRARLSAPSKPDQQQPAAEIPHPFLNSQKFRSFIQFDLNVKVAIFSRYHPPPSVSNVTLIWKLEWQRETTPALLPPGVAPTYRQGNGIGRCYNLEIPPLVPDCCVPV